MDRYAPSFEIDEEYLKLSLAEHHYQHSMKESVYHTYHREETRPVTPPRPPRTVAETTAETPHATTEADAIDNRTGILYQIDPASELVYTSTPAQEKGGCSMNRPSAHISVKCYVLQDVLIVSSDLFNSSCITMKLSLQDVLRMRITLTIFSCAIQSKYLINRYIIYDYS